MKKEMLISSSQNETRIAILESRESDKMKAEALEAEGIMQKIANCAS